MSLTAPRSDQAFAGRGCTDRHDPRDVEESGKTYVSPRIQAELHARDGLAVTRKDRRLPLTTDGQHSHPIAPNLLAQKFEATRPDTTRLADIAYVATGEG
ncbi:MAG: hypothetical protein ACR2RF_30095 [Geminicoccaceae bacterium]